MMPAPAWTAAPDDRALTPREEAIARSVMYAALFDYPLTLSQLRRTLIESEQTPTEIVRTVARSEALGALVESRDGYFFPVGRGDLIAIRRDREARSRAFLAGHRRLLRLIAALPYVSLAALSGSIAHLNLEAGGDLDLFVVTRGAHVWSAAVAIVLLAKLLGRRRTLCANYVVSDGALSFEPQDLFTASQIASLKPLSGADAYARVIAANPFVFAFYPNFHASGVHEEMLRVPAWMRMLKRLAERLLAGPAWIAERVCRMAYRSYLRRRAATWASPDQVVLGDTVLKLHTKSHRSAVLSRFNRIVMRT